MHMGVVGGSGVGSPKYVMFNRMVPDTCVLHE